MIWFLLFFALRDLSELDQKGLQLFENQMWDAGSELYTSPDKQELSAQNQFALHYNRALFALGKGQLAAASEQLREMIPFKPPSNMAMRRMLVARACLYQQLFERDASPVPPPLFYSPQRLWLMQTTSSIEQADALSAPSPLLAMCHVRVEQQLLDLQRRHRAFWYQHALPDEARILLADAIERIVAHFQLPINGNQRDLYARETDLILPLHKRIPTDHALPDGFFQTLAALTPEAASQFTAPYIRKLRHTQDPSVHLRVHLAQLALYHTITPLDVEALISDASGEQRPLLQKSAEAFKRGALTEANMLLCIVLMQLLARPAATAQELLSQAIEIGGTLYTLLALHEALGTHDFEALVEQSKGALKNVAAEFFQRAFEEQTQAFASRLDPTTCPPSLWNEVIPLFVEGWNFAILPPSLIALQKTLPPWQRALALLLDPPSSRSAPFSQMPPAQFLEDLEQEHPQKRPLNLPGRERSEW